MSEKRKKIWEVDPVAINAEYTSEISRAKAQGKDRVVSTLEEMEEIELNELINEYRTQKLKQRSLELKKEIEAMKGQTDGKEEKEEDLTTVAEMIKDMPEDKRQDFIKQYALMRTVQKNPEILLLQSMFETSKAAPAQTSPAELLKATFEVYNQIKQLSPPPEKSELQKLIEQKATELILGKLEGKQEPQETPLPPAQPPTDTNLVYDEETKEWIPAKMTWEQYQQFIKERREMKEREEEKLERKELERKKDERYTKMQKSLIEPAMRKALDIAGKISNVEIEARKAPRTRQQKSDIFSFKCEKCGTQIDVAPDANGVYPETVKCPKCGMEYRLEKQ